MKKLIRFLTCFALMSILIACSEAVTEKERVSNPSNTVDAVVAIRKTVAMPLKPTEIYLLPKGARISGEPAVKADNVKDLRVSWKGDAQLTIHAEKARVVMSAPIAEIRQPNGSRAMRIKIVQDIQNSK